MRILIIDNNINLNRWGARELRECAVKTAGATVWVRRGPQGDLPKDPTQYDRIIISGSQTSALESAPWISELHDFLRKAMDRRIPVLGVCYGHQVLIRALGGLELMRISEKPEIGWTRIEILGDSVLLRGLPRTFISFSSHFQEASALPQGLKLTARSERCAIQAFESLDSPVFGVQFHPERDLVFAEQTFRDYRDEKCAKGYFLEPKAGKKLYDPKVAERIFANFIELRT